ncbi:MAG: hypothetical protein ACJZ70_07775 [Limisphaerales bacterium]
MFGQSLGGVGAVIIFHIRPSCDLAVRCMRKVEPGTVGVRTGIGEE